MNPSELATFEFVFIIMQLSPCFEFCTLYFLAYKFCSYVLVLDDMIIAPGVRSDVSLEILGYLERDQFYYPRPRRFGSFVSWDPIYASTAYLPTEDVLQEIRRFCDETSEDILIISGQVYPEAIRLKYDLKNLKVFRPSVIRESVQNFVLYRMTPRS